MREKVRHTSGRTTRRGRVRALARTLAIVLTAALAGAAADATAAGEGANLYATLCASCHGISGRGDGPAAPALTPPPTDLTKSELKVPELMRIIDGRRTVRAHGDAAMPVWGHVFQDAMEGSGREHRDSLRQVQMLAEYVLSLEKK